MHRSPHGASPISNPALIWTAPSVQLRWGCTGGQVGRSITVTARIRRGGCLHDGRNADIPKVLTPKTRIS